ncbi:pentapeptide repeat-containing protein [Patescibacteria group bacterium]|nr:pentapeptide repeat-containing protein [Patescibacteria group bacterium]
MLSPTDSNFVNVSFTNTDFEKSVFSKTNLAKANFNGAKNYYIDVRQNNIKKAHFSLPEALSLLNSLDVIID